MLDEAVQNHPGYNDQIWSSEAVLMANIGDVLTGPRMLDSNLPAGSLMAITKASVSLGYPRLRYEVSCRMCNSITITYILHSLYLHTS